MIVLTFQERIVAIKIEATELIAAYENGYLNSIQADKTTERKIADWICTRLYSGAGDLPAN